MTERWMASLLNLLARRRRVQDGAGPPRRRRTAARDAGGQGVDMIIDPAASTGGSADCGDAGGGCGSGCGGCGS